MEDAAGLGFFLEERTKKGFVIRFDVGLGTDRDVRSNNIKYCCTRDERRFTYLGLLQSFLEASSVLT